MNSYNEYYINLMIKCDNGDESAINERESERWIKISEKIKFNDEFMNQIIKLSNDGNSFCMNTIAYMYYYGSGVEIDYCKSFEFFKKSSKKGNRNSMNNLGLMYHNCIGTHVDYQKAKKMYEKSINRGNLSALEDLARMYEKGHGVTKNYYKSAEMYKMNRYWKDFVRVINKIFLQNDADIDIESLKNLICDTDDKIYDEISTGRYIMIFKKGIQNEQQIARREIAKTVLLTKKIPIEIINNEINSRI